MLTTCTTPRATLTTSRAVDGGRGREPPRPARGARIAAPMARRAALVTRSTAGDEPHFEASPPRGECLLEDARDAMEACAKKGLSPEDEAACFLQFGCDGESVHAALDNNDSDDDKQDAKA